jgi:transposase-like protein
MDLIAIAKEFGTPAACFYFLEKMRWPEGVRCLKCDGEKVSKFVTKESTRKRISKRKGEVTVTVPARHLYQCLNSECGHQFTATTGTLFNDTHLPIQKWFFAVALITNAKKGLSAKQMQRDLKVSYQTAWYLCHRIREAMQGGADLFTGTVEMDEAYIGGRYDERRARAKYDKAPVVGVLQRGTKEKASQVQAMHVEHVDKSLVRSIINERVSFDANIYTDEGGIYRQLAKTHKHAIVVHSKDEYVRGEVHVNSLEGFWSLVKRQIIGQHHWVSVKHLQAYLNERVWSFNNRKEANLFALVIGALLIGNALPYAVLTANLEVVSSDDLSDDPR